MLVSTAHVVLGLLARGRQHGYDLKRDHDARFPRARPLAYGQVYATLDRLARDGLVTATAAGRDGGPDRTSYALTEHGRHALTDWLDQVEPPVPYVANALFTKVVVALLVDGSAATPRAYLRRQRAAHLTRMREFTAVKTAPDAPIADVLAADYALAHLDADLRWIDRALERVSTLRVELDPPPTPSRTEEPS